MTTPIRLVRSDGELIELMATSLTLNVDRSVNPHAIPGKGGRRYAFDLNLPKALISIEGIITDTDNLPSTSAASEASALVDFSLKENSELSWMDGIADTSIDLLPLDTATIFNTSLRIILDDTEVVYFVRTNGTPFEGTNSGGKKYVAIHDTSTNTDRTTQQIVSSLNTLIGSMSTLTSSIVEGNNDTPSERSNGALRITKVSKGKAGNNAGQPLVRSNTTIYGSPTIEPFAGGVDTTATKGTESAGDKVAQLFATLNNMNNYTRLGSTAATARFISDSTRSGRSGDLYGDYIIGIQIPFTSKVNSNESLFYMVTGNNTYAPDKEVDNANPVGTEFDAQYNFGFNYTGIKGTITQASFNQIGGEPLFSYTIQFVPVDFIL